MLSQSIFGHGRRGASGVFVELHQDGEWEMHMSSKDDCRSSNEKMKRKIVVLLQVGVLLYVSI